MQSIASLSLWGREQSGELKRQQVASQTSGRGTKRPATTSGVLRGLSPSLSLFSLVQQHGPSYSQESVLLAVCLELRGESFNLGRC